MPQLSLASRALARAKDYARAKQWRRVVALSWVAVRLDPKQPEAYYLLGLGLRYRQWWSAASRAYLKGATVDRELGDWLRDKRLAPVLRDTADGTRLRAMLVDHPRPDDKAGKLELIRKSEGGLAFPVGWWLALYARLVHLGWPAHAYAAKRRAAQIVIARAAEGEIPPDPQSAIELVQALIYDQRRDEARQVLGDQVVTRFEPHLARRAFRLRAFLAVESDATAARTLKRRKGASGDADRKFASFIRGKSVAIVGPADTCQSNGDEIDGFDLVVRMNVLDDNPVARPDQFGSRTSISYYNSTTENRRHAAMLSLLASRPFEFAVMRMAPPPDRAAAYERFVPVRTMMPVVRFFGGSPPLALPRILWDIRHFEPARVKVFNVDFYSGTKRYAEAYRSFDFNLATGLAYHDLVQSYDFTATLFAAGLFEADPVLQTVLGWGIEGYLARIDQAFATEPPR